VHAVSLLLDPVLRPGLAGLLIPFAAPYRPVATALGQIAAYGMLALGATFYVRRRIGTPALALGPSLVAGVLAVGGGPRPAGRHRLRHGVGARRPRAAGGRGPQRSWSRGCRARSSCSRGDRRGGGAP
jgi:hypothetical protein